MLHEARRILSVHDQALLRLEEGQPTRITIGCTETAAEHILPEVLGIVSSTRPGTQVHFCIDRSTQIAEAVKRGDVDLAVILGFGAETIGVPVGSLQLQWYASPDWRLPARGGRIALIAYAGPCGIRRRAVQALTDAGYQVEIGVESVSFEGVIAAARAGLGVAALPAAGDQPPAGLEARATLPGLGHIGVHLAARRGVDSKLEQSAYEELVQFFTGQSFQKLRTVSA